MSELRKDPIIDRWVIVAAERGRRPMDFAQAAEPALGAFSPFAPGQESKTPPELFQIGRPAQEPANSAGWRVRVVPNKFPALSIEGDLDYQGVGMYDTMNGVGAHEVIVENPSPYWDMATATAEEMYDVLCAYSQRMITLQEDRRFRYVLVFRNKGSAAGATIAHPHSQVIALPILPKQVKEKLEATRDYYLRKQRCIFGDMLQQELDMDQRVVEASEDFVVLSPFASRIPFELQIFPRRHCHDFAAQTEEELFNLGEILARSLRRIKMALNDPAYNLMLHTAPSLQPQAGRQHYWGTIADDFRWHIDILPRLTKVAGFEWGTGFYINPVSPEQATKFLREVEA